MTDLPPISESARTTLVWLGQLLRSGWTGRIELECTQGGIKAVKASQVFTPPEVRQGLAKPVTGPVVGE